MDFAASFALGREEGGIYHLYGPGLAIVHQLTASLSVDQLISDG